jgi:hypothetical protein
MRQPGQTLSERIDQVKRAIKRLEAAIQAGRVKLAIAPNGAISFAGWADRDNVTDACAYRTLSASNSVALRRAVMQAEAMSGRKVNAHAIAAGHHSHDGGKTWEPGH